MPARVFTETWIKNVRPSSKRQDYTELGRKRLVLRVNPGGAKTFIFRYGTGGATVITLGHWPAMSLAEAHREHGALEGMILRKLDPAEERKRIQNEKEVQEQKRQRSQVTIRNIIAEWAWYHARQKRKRPLEALRMLKANLVKAPLEGKPAHEITKRDLVLVIDRIVARGSRVMANRVRDLTVQVFCVRHRTRSDSKLPGSWPYGRARRARSGEGEKS